MAEFLKSFRAAPYVRRYLPPGRERRDCEARLCQMLDAVPNPTLWLEHATEVASASDQSRILSAMYAYRSQARVFLGIRKKFIAACENHARWLGAPSWRAERFWKPVKTETRKTPLSTQSA